MPQGRSEVQILHAQIVELREQKVDLLEALEAVAEGDSRLGVTCWCHRTDFHEIYCQQARAAIAKAISPQAR